MNAWYKEKFLKDIDRLLELRKTASPSQVEKIDESISIIESCIADEVKNVPTDLKRRIKYDREWMIGDDEFFLELLEEGLGNIPFLSYEHKYFYTPKLSRSDLFDLTHDFFQKVLDKDLYKIFRAVFKRRDRGLFMDHLREDGEIADTMYLPIYDRSYIRLRRKDAIYDITGLAHEYGHAIEMQSGYHPNLFREHVFFSEVASIFFELLCFDYLKMFKEFQKRALNEEKAMLNSRINGCSIYILENTLYSICAHLSLESKRDIRTFKYWFNSIVGGSEYEGMTLEEMFDELAPLDLPYYFSHIIAIEIFMVYLRDKDKGLYLMKRFISIDHSVTLDEYYSKIEKLGIEPNAHTKEFYEHIESGEKISF